MNKLPNIPSPPSHYWREFRHNVLPILVFSGVLALTIVLWNKHVIPASIVGEVEMVRANVTTVVPGQIIELNVDLLQEVEKDQVIGTVLAMTPEMVKASFAAIATDLETLRARMQQDQAGMTANLSRNQNSMEQLRMDWLIKKVDLATSRVNYEFANREYKRLENLFQAKAVSEAERDYAEGYRNALKVQVDELVGLVSEMETSIIKIQNNNTNLLPSAALINDPIAAAITAKQEELRAMEKVVLKAPIKGVISSVFRRVGEAVVAGEPIVVVSAQESDRIIGFIRQPVNAKPVLGAKVEVRSRSGTRPVAMAKVIKVGSQLEPVSPWLLPATVQASSNRVSEYGLQILVTVPRELKLMPGEMVDINLLAQE